MLGKWKKKKITKFKKGSDITVLNIAPGLANTATADFDQSAGAETVVRGETILIRLRFSLVNSHLTKSNYYRFCIFLKPRFRLSLIVQKT